MNRIRAAQTLWGLSRNVSVKGNKNGRALVSLRQICGGYNQDCSDLGVQLSDRDKKQRNQPNLRPHDDFPEFRVEDGKAAANLRSDGPGRMTRDLLHSESFAFQEQAPTRHAVSRAYKDETGEVHYKWDVAEETMERTWRQNVGRPVEERREKEIKTTGFPEAFKPRPMPHPDAGWNRPPEPIPKRQAEMHLPSRGGNMPNRVQMEEGSTKVREESLGKTK